MAEGPAAADGLRPAAVRAGVSRRFAVPAAVFAGYWLVAFVVHALNYARMPFLDGVGAGVASAFIDVSSWLLLWLIACVLADRLPLAGPRAFANLGLLLAAAVALLCGRIVLLSVLLSPFGWFDGAWTWYDAIAGMLPQNLFVFAMLWLGAWATVRQRQNAARERLISARQVHYLRVKLQTLMSRLEPHFIGNALHGVSSLIYDAPESARQMLVQLRSVVAAAAGDEERTEVRLEEEFEFTRAWLSVQQQRFPDRFAFRLTANPDVAQAWVPRLILQPLVENTIKHAVAATRRPVQLAVHARRDQDQLVLTVRDDGPGQHAQAPPRVGITNTRERLAVLYGPRAALHLRNRIHGGFEARLVLPVCAGPMLEQSAMPDIQTDVDDMAVTPRPSMTRPASGGVLASAIAVLVAAMTISHRSPMPDGLTGTAMAVTAAAAHVTSMVVPAAVALRLPRRFPVTAGGRAIAVAAALLAVLTATTFAMGMWAIGALRGAPAYALPHSYALAAMAVYLVVLNPLAAAYVAQHAALQEERDAVVRQLETAALQERQRQIATGITLPGIYEAFDRIEASLSGDPDAANRELTRLATRLDKALANEKTAGTHSR